MFGVVVAVQFCSFVQKFHSLSGAQLLGVASDYAAIFTGLALPLLLSLLSILPSTSSMGETCSVFSPRKEKPQTPPMKNPFCHLLQETVTLPASWFSLGSHRVFVELHNSERTRHQIEAALAGVCKHLRRCQKGNRAFSFKFPDQNSGQALNATFYTA